MILEILTTTNFKTLDNYQMENIDELKTWYLSWDENRCDLLVIWSHVSFVWFTTFI